MDKNLKKLMRVARYHMHISKDPIHDIGHTRRVVGHTEQLSHDLGLSQRQEEIVILAAWWHDVARSITKKPSFLWMFFIDDLISAVMLFKEAYRRRLIFNRTVNTAIRIIFCKTLSTSSLLPKILLRKKDRFLVDIVDDADNLDVINIERIKIIQRLAERSKIYAIGYKMTINWYLKSRQLYMKTKAAKKYVRRLIEKFIEWLKQKGVILWHIEIFGIKWVEKNLKNFEKLLKNISNISIEFNYTN